MRKLDIKETQGILLNVMIKFDSFCRENNIQYYMIGGTMLGAYRHKGFIPWDDDIDVGMVREQYELFLERSVSFDQKYNIVNYRSAKNCDYVITRIYIPGTYIDNPHYEKSKTDKRLYFDIFPLDHAPDERHEQELQSKKLLALKKKMNLMDFKTYNKRIDKVAARWIISKLLSKKRDRILSQLDQTMSKYKNTDFLCSMASQYKYEKQLFPIEIYGVPTEYSFEGMKFFGPEKADDYLSQLFGNDYMKLPPKDKRRPALNIYYED